MVTVLTRTIGPSGRDYASFTLAEADVTNIGTSADLVANDEAIVFEADAGTYSETLSTSSTLVSDATRNVTYKAAIGAEHGGDPASGPILQDATAATAVILLYDDYTAFDGLVVKKIAPGINRTIRTISAATDGIVFRNLIVENTGTSTQRAFEVQGSGILYENIVVTDTGDAFRYLGGTGQSHTHINCTIISATRGYYNTSGGGTVEIVNALNLNVTTNYSFNAGWTASGSNNFGGSTNPFPVAIQGSPYPITATTDTDPGAGDWAIYDATTGALVSDLDNDVLGRGIGPASNSDVPTTDIVGVTRSGTICAPGAFEIPPASQEINPPPFGGSVAGTPNFVGQVGILVEQIFSAEAFGAATVYFPVLEPTSIGSGEAFGSAFTGYGGATPLINFSLDSAVADVMTHVSFPLTTGTGQDRPIPGMVHTVNYYAQHLGWSSDQTAANDEPSPYGGDRITVIVPPPRGDGATP